MASGETDPRVPPVQGTAPPSAGRAPARSRGFKRWVFLALMAAGAASVATVAYKGGHVDARVLGPAELEAGPATQIVAWEGGRTAVQVSKLSALPADRLWRVVTDQGRFDEFMPYVRSTEVRPGPGGALIETQILDLPHASYDLELEIRLKEEGNVRTAAWRQLKGTLSYNHGAWVVEAHGPRTVLRYQVSASLGWVPDWAVNYAMRGRLTKLLDSVEERVRALEKAEPAYFQGK
ncbi:MAG: SRPBCC family protein [Planctomycetes bacterium]|nr:SRPBCC family protein [Planctomycetota bacterium]